MKVFERNRSAHNSTSSTSEIHDKPGESSVSKASSAKKSVEKHNINKKTGSGSSSRSSSVTSGHASPAGSGSRSRAASNIANDKKGAYCTLLYCLVNGFFLFILTQLP